MNLKEKKKKIQRSMNVLQKNKLQTMGNII